MILNPVHIRFNLESYKNIASKAPTLVTLTELNPLERVQHCYFPGPFSWVSHAAWLGLRTENHCGKWGLWTSNSSLDSPCYSNFMSLIQRGKMFWNTSLVISSPNNSPLSPHTFTALGRWRWAQSRLVICNPRWPLESSREPKTHPASTLDLLSQNYGGMGWLLLKTPSLSFNYAANMKNNGSSNERLAK